MYQIVYIMTMSRVSPHSLFNCTYMQHPTNCMAKCVLRNTLKAKAFMFLPGMDYILYYEVGVLEYTQLPQCTINKSHKRNAFFAQMFK